MNTPHTNNDLVPDAHHQIDEVNFAVGGQHADPIPAAKNNRDLIVAALMVLAALTALMILFGSA